MSRLIATYSSIGVMCGLLAACGAPANPQTAQLTPQSREHIAAAAEASGNTGLAMSMYAEAAAEAPGNSNISLRYAGILMQNGKIDQAREILTRNLAKASDPEDVRRGLGMIDVLSGLHGQAIAELDKVLATHPKDVPALVDKGVALDLAGNHAAAQSIYRAALELTPNDPAIANNLALSLALQGRASEAKAVLLPFRNDTAVPERMKGTMKVLADPSDGQPDAASGEEVRRLALALASVSRGGNSPEAGSDPQR
jgi:Flp pilus assembly protein TadD